MVQLSHPQMTTGKTMALTIWTFVGKVMSLLFNMILRFVIVFLPRKKCLLISWLQSPSAVILEPKKRKSVISPSICHEVMGPIDQQAYRWYTWLYIKFGFPFKILWEIQFQIVNALRALTWELNRNVFINDNTKHPPIHSHIIPFKLSATYYLIFFSLNILSTNFCWPLTASTVLSILHLLVSRIK